MTPDREPFYARWFRLSAREARLVLTFGALTAINAFAMQISYVSSISGFLKADGLDLIWVVWLIDYALILLFAAGQSLFIDRFDRLRLLRALVLIFAAAFGVLYATLQVGIDARWTYAALYLLAEQQWLLFPLFFWVLANDSVSVQQGKRMFPLMASWGLIGNLLGLLLAASAPALLPRLGFDPSHLLLLNAALYLLAWFVPARLTPREPSRRGGEPFREALLGGLEFVREVPAFRYLTWSLLALMLIDTIVEFHFLAVTDAVFVDQGAYQVFYGGYRIVTLLLAFLVQAFVAQRILARVSLPKVLSTQPFVALGSMAFVIALPGLAGAVGAMFSLRLVAETFFDSAKKSLQGLVPEERRGRVSLMLESVVISVGTMGGALLIGAVTLLSASGARFPMMPVYAAVAVAAAIAAIVASARMRATYDASLLNWRLKRRQRTGGSVLDKLL
jgi:ATP:ADP antiporter, AAA family